MPKHATDFVLEINRCVSTEYNALLVILKTNGLNVTTHSYRLYFSVTAVVQELCRRTSYSRRDNTQTHFPNCCFVVLDAFASLRANLSQS